MKSNIYLFDTRLETFQVDLHNPTDKDLKVFTPDNEAFLLLPNMKICLNRHSFKGFKFPVGRWTTHKRVNFRVKEIHKDKIKTITKSD